MGKPSKVKEAKKGDKYLEHGTVILNSEHQKINIHNTLYSWRVPKYHRLKNLTLYFQEFNSKDVKCVLKLIKTKNMFWVGLWSRRLSNKEAQFYIIGDTGLLSLNVQAKEIGGFKGLFTGQFSREDFDYENSPYLEKDILTVSFRYVSDRIPNYQESTFDGVDVIADLDELCADLKHMYLDALFPDFTIFAGNYTFKTHKFVLAARSDFFQKYLATNASSLMLEVKPGVLHEVLLYIYCGELKDMDLRCMMVVMELAVLLEITFLVDKCIDYFLKHVNKSNFNEFNAFQREKQFPALIEVVEMIKQKDESHS